MKQKPKKIYNKITIINLHIDFVTAHSQKDALVSILVLFVYRPFVSVSQTVSNN